MNVVESASKVSVSWLQTAVDCFFAVLFLATLSTAAAELILGRVLATVAAITATLLCGWACRGMLDHLDRWCGGCVD